MSRSMLFLLLLFAIGKVVAHPLAPALLELREMPNGHIDVMLKTSITLSEKLQQPIFSERCQLLSRQFPERVRDSRVERSRIDCGAQGLSGVSIAMSGDSDFELNVVINITRTNGRVVRALLSQARPQFIVPAHESASSVLADYMAMGAEHLLTGVDHLLFILGLVLWVRKRRELFLAVTAFTLGHSVTLALTSLNVLSLSSTLVEIGIAASILWLAIKLSLDQSSAGLRQAISLPFFFGLLHGLGFAGALVELGLPSEAIPLALFGFNVGIELGQLAFIGAIILLMSIPWGRFNQLKPLTKSLGVQFIGVMAAFWVIQRGFIFFF